MTGAPGLVDGALRLRLGFGTARIHRVARSADRVRLIHAAFDEGIRHFDTAPSYGMGLGEATLGRALSTRRSAVTLATKFGLYPSGSPSRSYGQMLIGKVLEKAFPGAYGIVRDFSMVRAERSLVHSLRTLRTDYVDYLFLHEPEIDFAQADELLEWCRQVRRKGLIRWWGLAGEAARVLPLQRCDHGLAEVIQTRYEASGIDHGPTSANRQRALFLYGISAAATACRTVGETLGRALADHPAATVLVSATDPGHLRELVTIARGSA